VIGYQFLTLQNHLQLKTLKKICPINQLHEINFSFDTPLGAITVSYGTRPLTWCH